MKYLQVKLSDNMHDDFKKACEKNKIGMSKVVKGWIDKYIKKHGA